VAVLVKPQTAPQILRCLTLGKHAARVVEGRLETRGPLPLAGPLPDSIRARRDELVEFLLEYGDGVWPPAPGSRLRTIEKSSGCGLAAALDVVDVVERTRRGAAA
jgi:hypothetical protein